MLVLSVNPYSLYKCGQAACICRPGNMDAKDDFSVSKLVCTVRKRSRNGHCYGVDVFEY